MVATVKSTRFERYSERVAELDGIRKSALARVIFWIALIVIDCIGGVIVFYQDESMGYEPIFWVVLIGILIICYVGYYLRYAKYTKARGNYNEAAERLQKLSRQIEKAPEAASE